MLTWRRVPSVTTGGKAYFFNAYVGADYCGTVVWHRGARQYLAEYAGRPIGWYDTVRAGKAAVRAAHSAPKPDCAPHLG